MPFPISRLFAVVAVFMVSGGLTDAVAEPPAPLRVVIAHGPGKGDLHRFAEYLEANYRVTCSFAVAEKARKPNGADKFAPTPVNNLEAFEQADVIVSNFYRTWAPPVQLKRLKTYFTHTPVVGLRKAHHGFQNWLEADREVFGVNYRGHYFGKNVTQKIVAKSPKNKALPAGLKPVLPAGGLYRHTDLDEDAEVLIIGGPEDKQPLPQTWKRVDEKRHQRVFYTRYDPRDLKHAGVRDMVIRAMFWAAEKNPETYRRKSK